MSKHKQQKLSKRKTSNLLQSIGASKIPDRLHYDEATQYSVELSMQLPLKIIVRPLCLTINIINFNLPLSFLLWSSGKGT